jgi:hypothetical protein
VSVNGKFPEQLIAMVSHDMKADIRAEADAREVSISQIVREAREIQLASRQPMKWVLGEGTPPADPDYVHVGDLAYAPERLQTGDGKLFEHVGDGSYVPADPETLAAYARNLAPDTEPDDVDGSLSDAEARVARLRARGLG